MKRTIKGLTAATAVALVVTACGQKTGVHQVTLGGVQTPGGFVTGLPSVDPSTGETLPPGVVLPSGGATTGPTGGSTSGPTTGPGVTITGDRTGITDTTITIGIHAPTTGAAPIESIVFEKGKDVYWKWLESKGRSVLGRTVEVVFADDTYKPTTAVAVCKQMAEDRKAFLLVGGAGTDQINACSQYAEPRGIPYLSPGVQEAGLSTRSTYFAVTMSYRAQMAPLVQLLKKLNGGNNALDRFGGPTGGPNQKIKVAFIRPNTPNFNDAADALEAAVHGAGWEYKVYSVVKEGNSSEAQTVAAQLQQQGVDIAIPITAPLFTTQLVINSDKNGYKPMWSGVAVTNNVNAMIDTACKSGNGMDGAVFFSPWPGLRELTDPDKPLDPDFVEAAKKFAPDVFNRKNGDLLYALWGISRGVHLMLEHAGANVTRESFIASMNSFSFKSNLFPTLQYASGPFGAKDVNVLQGKCSQGGNGNIENGAQWITHPKYPGLHSSF